MRKSSGGMRMTWVMVGGLAVAGAGWSACASKGETPGTGTAIPADGPVDGAPSDWGGALFTEGASATYALTEERSAVTPEAAERGGPTSAADWTSSKSTGAITCTVAKVTKVGDTTLSNITCTGYNFEAMSSPVAGVWAIGPKGLAHGYGDDLGPNGIEQMFGAEAIPLLAAEPRTGRRINDQVEVVVATRNKLVCATDTMQMGDDGGTETCFERGAWPASFRSSGGAAWMTSTVTLTRK